jgi:Tol biopolymer transport system component
VRFTVAAPFGSRRAPLEPFAVSPDGNTIAFTAMGPDRVRHIFTRSLERPDAQMVPGTEGANTPIWSPDSRSLAFGRTNGLFRCDLDGAQPRRLASNPDTAVNVLTGAWSPHGVIVFQSVGAGLSQVADSGGTPTPVTTLDVANGEVSHSSPTFLPDGRRLMFLALAANQIKGVIWVVSLDDPKRTRLAESVGGAAYADGWLLTTSGGSRSLVAQRFDPARLTVDAVVQPIRDRLGNGSTGGRHGFSVSSTGVLVVDRPPPARRQLTWMDRAGRTITTIGPAGGIREFSLAPDERSAAANVDDEQGGVLDLWVFNSEQPEGTRLTYGTVVSRPMWSHDGRLVYFTGRPNMELKSLKLGSSEPQPFENPAAFVHFEDVTRDGRFVILKTPFSSTTDIWLQRVDDPSQRRALVRSPFPASHGRVSPNARWLTYTLSLPGGPQVFIQPFDRPGDRVQVSRTGGFGAVWRPDNQELYYEGKDGLTAVTISEQDGTPVIGASQTLFGLRTQGLTVNQPHNIAVAANGEKFLVNAIVGESDNVPLEVTLNWTADLKK